MLRILALPGGVTLGWAMLLPMLGDAAVPPHLAASGHNAARAHAPAAGEAIMAQCGADKVGAFLGQHASPAVMARLTSAAGAYPIRWVHPGEAVTQDYRPNRLNVIVGEEGMIEALRCG